MSENWLYYGDNLEVLREKIPDECVDLVYLDPPFNSNQDYNILFTERNGTRAAAQIKAFGDTWMWDEGSALAYEELIETSPEKVVQTMRAFRALLGENDMLAYLSMMGPRLLELWRVLKPNGSLYLHCDTTAGHYLKLLLDAVFGPQLFRNEVIWKRTNVHNDSKTWSHVTDSLFFYTKSQSFYWNPPYTEHNPEYVASKYRNTDRDGRRYQLDNMTSPKPRPRMMYEWKGHASPPNGWRYSRETMEKLDSEGRIWYPDSKQKRPRLKRYLDEMQGTLLTNVWVDIPPLNSRAAERLGYPTQKPLTLVERIINASCPPGGTVLDPFCGCGTTVEAAQKLGCRWIGIDITILAVNLIETRLRPLGAVYKRDGLPGTIQEARALAQQDRHEFQWWALTLVHARGTERRKGADHGVDGRLFFHDEPGKAATRQIVFSVKSGLNVGVSDVRELSDVVRREGAEIGVLITLERETEQMRKWAASAGFYESRAWGRKYPRIQIRTIQQLLDGVKVEYPETAGGNVTFKPARPKKAKVAEQADLPLSTDRETILAERAKLEAERQKIMHGPRSLRKRHLRGSRTGEVAPPTGPSKRK